MIPRPHERKARPGANRPGGFDSFCDATMTTRPAQHSRPDDAFHWVSLRRTSLGESWGSILPDFSPYRLLAGAKRGARAGGMKGILECGLPLAPGGSGTLLRGESGKCRLEGVHWCGSRRCPACGPRLGRRDAESLLRQLEPLMAGGSTVTHVTLGIASVPHGGLADGFDALKALWQRCTAGRDRALPKGCSYVKALDVTRSPTHWHPHLHVLVIATPGQSAEAIGDDLVHTWLNAALAEGVSAARGAQDVRRVESAQHLAAAVRYITSPPVADTRKAKGRFGIGFLAWAASLPDARGAISMLGEYYSAVRNRRLLTVSRSLRLSDEAPCEEKAEEVLEPVARLTARALDRGGLALIGDASAARASRAEILAALHRVLGPPGADWWPVSGPAPPCFFPRPKAEPPDHLAARTLH